jgi:serine/threonine protein kinase
MATSPDVKSIFGKALELLTPAERAAYLEQACGDDAALRREVDGLLQALAKAGHFMDHPAVASPGPSISPSDEEAVGVVIGPYKLSQKLGEGGMGVVYLAEQEQPVKRRVALKVIKAGMDSRQVIARFERERQTLELMDHPNIAQVLDAGTTDGESGRLGAGRPFVAMELVTGIPITRFCDQQRLTVRERLDLFIPVCHAVQHAHQKGIIHRDLKPSNVLITLYDGRPVPKVIDFGVAKAISGTMSERALFTEAGVLIGTPEYMAPEQADLNNLDIDTRADIYSLGVILYELLAGAPPFSSQQLRDVGFLEMLRLVREVEPPKPSTRLSQMRNAERGVRNTPHSELRIPNLYELDWIVMKCLEKDRSRRYETANSFAQDIQRYLNDEPVLAGPPSAAYRLRKYARKHRSALATMGAFVVLLVAATISSIALASWALRERDHAQQQKQSAEANFQRALEAVDTMTRVGEVELSHVPHMEPVRRDLLQDALRFYQEFLREKGNNPVVRSEAARAYRRVGKIEILLGQPDKGEAAYGQALSLLQELVAESRRDPSFVNELAGVHMDWGLLYHSTQRWPQAEASLQQAVKLLEQLEREHPTFSKHRHTLAETQAKLVSLYRQVGRLEQAEMAFLKCKALSENLLAGDPKDLKALDFLAGCYQNVALVYGAQGDTARAEEACREALARFGQLVRDDPEAVEHRRRLAGTYNNLGLFYARQGQHEKAETAYQQALDHKEAILRDHPKVVAFVVDLANSYTNMATHVRRRSPEEALDWGARAIRILEPVLEKDPRYVHARMCLFDTLMGRAYALRRLGRDEDMAKEWRRVVEVSEGQSHINMRLYRPIALVSAGEYARGTAEIETLLAEGHAHGRHLYTFAYLHSLSSAAAASDARLSAAEREKLADSYGGRAVELLRQAQAAGHFQNPDRLDHMKQDKDLDPIRSRPDFQGLLAELEGLEAGAP